MKINNVTPLNQAHKVEQNKTGAKSSVEASGNAAGTGASAQAHLSHGASDASQDIDLARVAEIKQAIQEGRLQIDSEKIADGLIASVRNMLGEDK